MQITIVLDTTIATDAAALARLLGGTTAAPTPTPEPVHPLATSDALIEQEARRAAGEHTGDTNGGEDSPPVDSSSLPWDARIHSLSSDGSKPTNANGTWRRKRGVDDATVAAVEAELRGAEAPVDTVVPPPPVTDAVPPPPTNDAAGSTTAPPAPPSTPAVADTTSGPVDAASASNGSRFESFAKLTAAVQEKCPGINYDALNAHGAAFGLTKWIDIRARPELWDDYYDTLEG